MAETSTPETAAEPAGKRPIHGPGGSGMVRRSAGTVRRWAKDTFSRDQLVAGLKQLAWVAPLTVLIWVYAEREQQVTSPLPVAVVARSSNPQLHVRLIDPPNGLVQVTVRGSRSRVEDITKQVGTKAPVVIDVSADGKTGLQSIPVSSILDQDPRFRGLTIQSGTPTVDVDVQPIDEEMLAVQLRPEDRAQLVQQPVFSPARVKVRLPRDVADAAKSLNQGQLVVYAEAGKLSPGKSAPSNLRVVVAGVAGADAEDVRVEPETVAATFEVRAADETLDLDIVPIGMIVVPGVSNTHEIAYTPATVFNVKVVGPREAMEQLRSSGTSVMATIRVSREDEGEERDKTIEFMLPPDVRIHPESPHDKVVKLTVTRKGSLTE